MSTTLSVIYGTANPIPYTNAEVPELQFSQSANMMVIAHPSHPPATLTRYGVSDWRYEQPVFKHGPYLPSIDGDEEISLSLSSVTDRLTLTSTNASEFTGLPTDTLVEYSISDQKVLGKIKTTGTGAVIVEPLEDQSMVLAKEVYSPGLFSSWDATNNVPVYDSTITGSGVSVAFSNTQVATRSLVGNYLRFSNKAGTYYWMLVTEVGDILQQGAYGILAKGNILTVTKPTGVISQSARTITGTLASSVAFFSATTDIGRLFRLNLNETIIHCRCTAFTSTTSVSVSMTSPVPLTIDGTDRVLNSVTTDWRKGAWYVGNYPATVTFHEQRLVFGGSLIQPQTFSMSKTADFFNFAATESNNQVNDDSAIDVTISSDTVNAILWMSTHTTLLAGTVGSEWVVAASTQRQALTPANITANQQSSYGSEFAKAITVGHSVFYIQRGANKLREMVYDSGGDAYASMDVTVFAEHILRDHGGAIQLAYQHLPESVLYVLCADGQICALTYEPDQKVYSWFRIVLGGSQAACTSIATQLVGDQSVLFMVVRRWVSGAWVYTTEKLLPTYEPTSSTDFSEMVFLDLATELTIGGSLTYSGYTNFASQTISALIDNVVYDNIVVSVSGVFTLPVAPVARCWIGHNYRSTFKSFPLETQGRRGTTQGKIKTVNAITARVRNTLGFKHGVDLSTLSTEAIPSPLSHQTEDIRVPLPNNYDTRGSYYIVQDRAYPLTILALYPEVALHQ